MNAFVLLMCVSVAGGVGAVCRFVCDTFIARRAKLPVATMLVNVTGSFAAGVAAGGVSQVLPDSLATIVMTGFLGGYTTFSTASMHTAEFLMRREWKSAFVTGIVQLLASVAAALIGLTVGVALW